ncbi:MAG TPA: dolichyl-phosphate beta-glucosyltransferase [Terriglobales bacterium]|nr:dolichyl-phosphate beta-glucosyltransferase [Terriglobales bacterium]
MGTLGDAHVTVDVVLPVFNEQATLTASVGRLHGHLNEHVPYGWRIVIADNASTDRTPAVAEALCEQFDRLRVIRLEQKGRGRALRTAWTDSQASVLSYMDIDLSTELDAYYPLVRAIVEEGYDLAIGSRLAAGAIVVGRRPVREVASRVYNLITRLAFRTAVVDAQCGFKAISRATAERLLPEVADNEWFFDTELLIRAERHGCSIRQLPVHWIDDPNSHVRLVQTALQDLKGIWRLKRSGF